MTHYAFNWFALPPLVTALCSLLTGLMLYRREWTSRVGQALMGVTFAIAFWFVASGMLYLSVDESTALLWARISYIAVPLLPATVFLYISIGLRSYDKQKILVWSSFLAGIVFVVIAYNTDLLISGVHHYWWGYYPAYGGVGNVFLGYYVLVIVAGQVLFRVMLASTVRGTLYNRRTRMSTRRAGERYRWPWLTSSPSTGLLFTRSDTWRLLPSWPSSSSPRDGIAWCT